MRMDYTDEELEDLAAMRERRLILRALADAKIAECQAMLPARNWLDMNRQIKAVMAVDRLVVALWSPPPRRRRRSAKPAATSPYTSPPRSEMPAATPAKTEADPLPPPYAEHGEVSAGALRRMTEGSSPAPDASQLDNPEDAELLAALTHNARESVNEATRRCAEWAGVWPDGASFIRAKAGWREHALTDTLTVPLDVDTDIEAWLHNEMLSRCNAIARQAARLAGVWFDSTPFTETDPDYFAMSANYGTNIAHRADGENKGPRRLPWWIVRKPRRDEDKV